MVVRRVLFGALVGLALSASDHASANSDCQSDEIQRSSSCRSITADDLVALRDLEALSLSPDGRHVVFFTRQAKLASNGYESGWYVASIGESSAPTQIDDGGELNPLQLESGIKNGNWEVLPALWSPDSRSIVYLKREHGIVGLWKSGIIGGTTERVDTGSVNVRGLAWSRDGSRIFFETESPPYPEKIDSDSDQGYLFDDRFYPFIGPKPIATRSTSSGAATLRVADATSGTVRDPTRTEIDEYKNQRKRLDEQAHDRVVRRAPVGKAIAWLKRAGDAKGVRAPLTVVTSRNGSTGNAEECTAAECTGRITNLWWASNARDIVFMRYEGIGYAFPRLYKWNSKAHNVEPLRRDDDEFLFDCDAESGTLVCFKEMPTVPRTLVTVDMSTGQVRTLYDPNPEFQRIALQPAELLRWSDADGVHAFGHLVKPPNFADDERYPLIISTYRSRGFLRGGVGDEYPIQLFAQAGFAVLSFDSPSDWEFEATAPDWDAVNKRNYEGARDDKLALSSLEAVISKLTDDGTIDPTRIAITGLSHGAEITLYAISHSKRFAAAAVSGPSWDPLYYYLGGPAIQQTLQSWGYGIPTGSTAPAWQHVSTSLNAASIDAALLIQSADSEYVLALQLYSTMRALSKPVELHVFPGEHHIKMQPRHRLHIYRRNVDWLKFWLLNSESSAVGERAQYDRWRILRGMQDEYSGGPSSSETERTTVELAQRQSLRRRPGNR